VEGATPATGVTVTDGLWALAVAVAIPASTLMIDAVDTDGSNAVAVAGALPASGWTNGAGG